MKQVEAMQELVGLCDAIGAPVRRGAVARSQDLRRLAMRLNRINERRCNGVIGADGFAKWDDADEAKATREEDRSQRRAMECFAEVLGDHSSKVRISFQGDPRGASIAVYFADDIDSAGHRRIAFARCRLASFW